jgi:hypothetical protein
MNAASSLLFDRLYAKKSGTWMDECEAPAQPPDGDHYREIASKVWELARRCRFPGATKELLQLAANFEGRYLVDRQNPD